MNGLWRILFLMNRLFSGARYRINRRFTRGGQVLLVSLFVAGFMGIDMENTVAYQAFTIIIFVLLVSCAFGWFFRAKIPVTRKLPRFATMGKPFQYVVELRNGGRKTQNGLDLIEDLQDVRPGFHEWIAVMKAEQKRVRSFSMAGRRLRNPYKVATIREVTIPEMKPGAIMELLIEALPLQRGVIRFSGVTFARADPLGLFRALFRVPLEQSVLILPKRYELPPIALPGQLKYQEGGVAQASNVGQSEEFVALRDYRRGDPIRHIHWRSWAKTGMPIVKEFADEFFVRHALVLDTFSGDPRSEAFEEAVSVAASFACTIQTQESLLDLLFVGAEAYCFTSGRGLAHADQMLEILASVRINAGKPFANLETLVLNHAASVSGCICILLDWDLPRRAFVEKLKASGVPVRVVIVLSKQPDKPFEPGPMHDEPEHFHTLVAGRIEEGLAKL